MPYEEILTGPGPGSVGPQIRGFRDTGTPIGKVNFYAYGTLKFGANVGVGELDGDLFEEMLSAAGPGAVFGPHIRGWNYDGAALSTIAKINFFAYATLRYGVGVATGDIEGDTFDEILTGPGPGVIFGSTVRGWNYDGARLTSIAKVNFNAFTYQYGVNVAGGDVDGDGQHEMATAPGPGPATPPQMRGFDYDGSSVSALPGFQATLPGTTFYGGRVGLANVAQGGVDDLLAGLGRDPSAASTVHPYSYDGTALAGLPTLLPFATYTYGANVTGGSLGP